MQGGVVTVILSRPDGSEIPVRNTTKPISIRLARPFDKRPKYQDHQLNGTDFAYHKVSIPDKQMTLSIYVAPSYSPMDTYAVYISFGANDTLLEPPTETKFDLLFVVPNRTAIAPESDVNLDDEHELRHTIFLPPGVHLGNGTYILGVKLVSK